MLSYTIGKEAGDKRQDMKWRGEGQSVVSVNQPVVVPRYFLGGKNPLVVQGYKLNCTVRRVYHKNLKDST